MKKWIAAILMVVFAAGVSVAENKSPWWKFGFGGQDEPQVQTEPAPRHQPGRRPDMMQKGRRSDMQNNRRAKMSNEQRAKMKAYYEEIQKLAVAARTETDPAKKAELTEQLRVKLTQNAKKMQAEFRKRVEKAEQELGKMKERLDKGEGNMEKRVDEHLKKLLAGEKLEHKGKGGPKEGKQRKKGPPTE